MESKEILEVFAQIKGGILNLPLTRFPITKEKMYVCSEDAKIEAFLKVMNHPILQEDHSKALYSFTVIVDDSLVPDCFYVIWNNDPQDNGYLLFYLPRFMETFFDFGYFIDLSKLSSLEISNKITGQLQEIEEKLNHKFKYKVWQEHSGHSLSFSTDSGLKYMLEKKFK